MTENELKKIFDEANKELSASLNVDKVRSCLTDLDGDTSQEAVIAKSIAFSVKLNQELLFKVLSKALCKDSAK